MDSSFNIYAKRPLNWALANMEEAYEMPWNAPSQQDINVLLSYKLYVGNLKILNLLWIVFKQLYQ